MFKSLRDYINPMARLGRRKYSLLFPLVTTLIFYVLSEFFAYQIARDPMVVGGYVIFLSVGLIIYFAFRDGIGGGVIPTTLTIAYYLYIIYSRHYSGQMLSSGLDTTAILTAIFLVLALIIGWLKQTIDRLIEQEADQRRRLESIIEQLPIGVIITDANGRLTHQNKRLELILGTKFPANFTFGRKALLKGSLDGKKVDPQNSPVLEVLANKGSISDREYIVQRRNGSKAFLQVSASVIRNSAGKVIAASGIINDVTSQKELERLKDEFISIASHELKTPITTIKGFTEIMLAKQKKRNKKSLEITL